MVFTEKEKLATKEMDKKYQNYNLKLKTKRKTQAIKEISLPCAM